MIVRQHGKGKWIDLLHGGIMIVRQHGKGKWNFRRIVTLQDFVWPHIKPHLFTSKLLRNIRPVFARNLGTVRGVNGGGHSYQV